MEHKKRQLRLLKSEGYEAIKKVLQEHCEGPDAIMNFNPSEILADIINIMEHYDKQIDLLEKI